MYRMVDQFPFHRYGCGQEAEQFLRQCHRPDRGYIFWPVNLSPPRSFPEQGNWITLGQ